MPVTEAHPQPAVKMRHYAPPDLESCRALWTELTQRHRDIYGDNTIGGDNPGRFFDEHLGRVGASRIFVAEIDGAVVAMAGMDVKGKEAELEPVIVTAGRRGHGIGNALVSRCAEAAREVGVRFLRVGPVARNEAAIRFFRSAGFDKLAEVNLYMDFGSEDERFWKKGVRLGDIDFEY